MTAGQRTAVLVTYGGLVCPARFHGTQGPGPMDHIAQVRISGVYLGSGPLIPALQGVLSRHCLGRLTGAGARNPGIPQIWGCMEDDQLLSLWVIATTESDYF